MLDREKSKEQLIEELAELRQQVAVLKGIEAERRRAEEELARSKAILTAVVESLPFDFFALDPTGRCFLQNAVSRKYYGNALGKTAEEVCPDPQVVPRWLAVNHRALTGEQIEAETELRVGGTQHCFFSVLGPILQDGTSYGMLGINVDITRQKLAERALRESEARYRALAESTRDIIYILDRQGTLLYANQAASRCIGIDCDQLVGKRQAELFPPEMARVHREKTEQVFTTGAVIVEDERFHFGPEEVWLRVHLLPLRDEAGNITAAMGVCHNITDRKRAETALKQAHDDLERRVEERTTELSATAKRLQQEIEERKWSERRFRNYFDQGLIGMAVTSMDKRWLEVNDRMCEIMGRSREELLQSNWADLTHPDDLEPNLILYRQLLAGEIDHYTMDKRFFRKDGSIVYATIHIRAFRNDDGSIDHCVSLTEDISERKRVEEALRQSLDQLRAIYDGMFDGLLILDLSTKRFVGVNPAICRMLGYSADELLSMSVTEIHPVDEILQVLQRLQARAEERFHGYATAQVLRKDGTILSVDIASNLLNYGGRPCITGFFRDVTERKRAESALQQSHEHLQAVYDGMVDGFVIFDTESFQTIQANAALCNMLGYSEEEIKTLTAEQKHPVGAIPRLREHYEATLRGQQSPIEDVPLFRQDGSLLYFDIAVKSLLYNGRRCQLLFFHDVTQRRQDRIALERERRTLEHMLRASDRERQLIAYDIHDGLAQHLAGAIMQFDAFGHLRATKPKQATDAFHAGITMLRQAHGEARRLISGVRPPILDEAGVMAAIAHLVNERRAEQSPKIEIHSKVKFARLASILENAIYRIVQEGLTNACKHSKSARVRISLLQRNDRLRIVIRDWGAGFNPKIAQDNRYGLAGMRERARLLGGTFRIRSKPGAGTSIVVEVPIVEKASEE